MAQCVRCGITYNEKFNNQCPRCGQNDASTTGGGVATPLGSGSTVLPPGT